ncbi:MAG: toxin-antitoxin system PIN domain toxin [Cryomorphaceae bacterium]|jgi:toxin-antitoxin system PIN domain toxin
MIGIDTNILLCAVYPKALNHEKAKAILETWKESSDLVIAELVLVELYQLLMNPLVIKKKLSASEAVQMIEVFRKNPKWQLVENAPVMDEVWRIAGKDGFARRRLFDVRLGLTLQHHGVTQFATANTKDFMDLGFERVWNPLMEQV